MKEGVLFLLQRATALLLAPLVLAHLALVLYATQGGLSAAEILARTRGSLLWGGFYGLFVLAVAIHGAIGLRAILAEWTGLRGRTLEGITLAVALLLLVLGLRAVRAVVGAP